MTTFEITIIVLLAAIVMLLIIAFIGGVATINARMEKSFQCLGKKIEYLSTKLGYINGTAQSISQQLDNIEDKILDDLRDIRLAQEFGKTPPNVPITPCYAPDGICTNPQMDCINCPKRSTGGTLSTNTSIKAEDAPLQERFNDNKED